MRQTGAGGLTAGIATRTSSVILLKMAQPVFQTEKGEPAGSTVVYTGREKRLPGEGARLHDAWRARDLHRGFVHLIDLTLTVQSSGPNR